MRLAGIPIESKVYLVGNAVIAEFAEFDRICIFLAVVS
jgi:hypothetical protein